MTSRGSSAKRWRAQRRANKLAAKHAAIAGDGSLIIGAGETDVPPPFKGGGCDVVVVHGDGHSFTIRQQGTDQTVSAGVIARLVRKAFRDSTRPILLVSARPGAAWDLPARELAGELKRPVMWLEAETRAPVRAAAAA